MIELTLTMPDDLIERLQDEAKRRHVTLDDVIRTAILHFFDEDEPTKAEILAGLREAMEDALAGRVLPAHEVLDEFTLQ